MLFVVVFFFFQAEDGIRDAQESRGLGDVYKRQGFGPVDFDDTPARQSTDAQRDIEPERAGGYDLNILSLIHI